MNSRSRLNQLALDPQCNVVVEACAGSGKTWLLVSRIVRLLLAGAHPSEILAITFTRKAAQEMEERLREWLQLLAIASDVEVHEFLRQRGLSEHDVAALMTPARWQLERLLTAEPGITVSTFHGWFLEILKRAPLDSGAVGNVVLIERTSALVNEAWDEFAQSLRRDHDLAPSFNALLERVGLFNARMLLTRFLHDRARWWAYTDGCSDPVSFALSELRAQLGVETDANAAGRVMSDHAFLAALRAVYDAFRRGTDASRGRAEKINAALAAPDVHQQFADLCACLLTREDEPNSNLVKACARDRRGTSEAHAIVCDRLRAAKLALIEQNNYRLHEAALPCAIALVETYQELKRQRGGMDFTDLEWRAWQLLSRSDHAEYMQFKLDARYRHVLVDEFQDTNPLQWRILLAWLEASQAVGRAPSVFLVGDPKQSIYRFRGAEARLFELGKSYVEQELEGRAVSLIESRRSGPPIIEAVNRVFDNADQFEDFERHAAHHSDLPGRVEVLALARKPAGTVDASLLTPHSSPLALRDPLMVPRAEEPEHAREAEADQLVAGIERIVGRWGIREETGQLTRPARFEDITVLVRRRTHLHVYERKLREAQIPYVTTREGGLLQTLEAVDVTALLRFLITPFADLNLAATLRSPVFSCSDADLIALACGEGRTWWHRLERLANEEQASPALMRARRLLRGWRELVDSLPVHDLLDRIYFEGDVLQRYEASVPDAMREGVLANLQAFIGLALEIDAGRYPSLPRFLDELASLRRGDNDEAPDEGIAGDAGNAVRILTVHGAKGLEAPVVWLLDANQPPRNEEAFRVLVDWQPEENRPRHFSLLTTKSDRGHARSTILDLEAMLAAREELNVLYVVMTRAKQALIVSGVENSKKGATWYRRIADALGFDDEGGIFGEDLAASLPLPEWSHQSAPGAHVAAIGEALTRPLPTGSRVSAFVSAATLRGERLHVLLQHLAPPVAVTDRAWLRETIGVSEDEFELLWSDAQAILTAPELRRFFDPASYVSARNEVPYVDANGELRRIDRVVEFEDEIWVLDYKTGEPLDADRLHAAAAKYRTQLAEYCRAFGTLRPGKPVRAAVVFRDGRWCAVSMTS